MSVEIIDLGSIRSIEVPYGWTRQDKPDGFGSMVSSFVYSGEKSQASFAVFEHPISINVEDGQAFHKMLADHSPLSAEKILQADEIRALAQVIGVGHAGDNQYTNSVPYPSPRSPAFRISSARLIAVNGKTVLAVEGNYMTDEGMPTNCVRSIYAEADSSGRNVVELYMKSADHRDFILNEGNFRNLINSIIWR